MIHEDGTCRTCPPYTTLQADKRACIEPECYRNEVITTDGTCKPCDHPSRPSLPDRKSCIKEGCASHMKLNYDGNCIECPAGTIVSKD